jgi:hypothetical protein
MIVLVPKLCFHWKSREEAEERYEEIWQELSYIYKANLSEEKMIDLLRTRSGMLLLLLTLVRIGTTLLNWNVRLVLSL